VESVPWIFLAVGVLLVLVSCSPGSRTIAGSSAGAMKYGLNTAIAVALVLGATVVVRRSRSATARVDLTENSVSACRRRTIQLLGGLKTDGARSPPATSQPRAG
jgi:hypothetical protein